VNLLDSRLTALSKWALPSGSAPKVRKRLRTQATHPVFSSREGCGGRTGRGYEEANLPKERQRQRPFDKLRATDKEGVDVKGGWRRLPREYGVRRVVRLRYRELILLLDAVFRGWYDACSCLT